MDVEAKILDILNEEVVPAQGCTEPIAIAFTAAKAREILDERVLRVVVKVSGNMIKNVKSVVVPNSGGLAGIETSAAMGIIAGDASRDLMVISAITPAQMSDVNAFLARNVIDVIHEQTDAKLYVKVIVYGETSSASVEIKHMHTNITQIVKNERLILDRPCNDTDFNSASEDRKILNIALNYDMAKRIEMHKIRPLFERVIELNSIIAREGLDGV